MKPIRKKLAEIKLPRIRLINLTVAASRLSLLFALWLLVEFNLIPLALFLVLLVKWRAFAIKPHWWWPRLRMNFVDLAIGLTVVFFLAASIDNTFGQIFWLSFYGLWQFVFKNWSSVHGCIFQGLICQTLAIASLFYYNPFSRPNHFLVIAAIWLISYFSARHSISWLEESPLKSAWPPVWGLFSLQLATVLLHWQIWLGPIPHFVFLQTIINLSLLYGFYWHSSGKLKPADRRQLIAISLVLVLIVLLFANWQSQTV